MRKFSKLYAVWLLMFVLTPLFIIVIYSFNGREAMGLKDYVFSFGNFQRFFEPIYIKILLVSVGVAATATIFCFLVGYPCAYYISRLEERKRNNMILLFVVPMWMNFLLRTYAWLTLLGTNGLINKFLGIFGIGPLNIMYNMTAIMLGMIYNFLPFMVLPIYSALVKMDTSLIEAAKDLGATDSQVFRKVIFPLSLPAVYTGITMVFIPAISSFVIPNLLGGNKFYLIGNLIEQQYTFTGNWPFGSAVSVILIIIMLAILELPKLFNKKFVSDKESGAW